jgi:ABC-type glycerol-3-phosphate transport system permease component
MKRNRVGGLFVYAINAAVGIVFILPLLWMVVTSFKPERRVFVDISSIKAFLPIDFTLQNYARVLQRIPMLRYIGNSVLYISAILACSLTISSMCGYALAKFRFRGRSFMLSVIIGLMVFPFDSILVPLYIVVSRLHMINSYLALIVPFTAKCFSIFMFRQFFLDVPDDLLEAAEIDGSSRIRTFLSIVVPISGAVFATVFILDFVTHWSDFIWPLIVLTAPDLRTVQIGIQGFFTEPPLFYGAIMASLTMAVIPVIVMFLLFQRYYVQGISTTGLKG